MPRKNERKFTGPDAKVTLRRTIRPVRLCFLIEGEDAAALRRVTEINTCIWGGVFNGIVPVLKEIPKSWEDIPERLSPKQIVDGYIEAFEPDYVVRMDSGEIDIAFPKTRVLTAEQVLAVKENAKIAFGISATDLYAELFEREFRFTARERPEVVCAPSGNRADLFFAVAMGEFPAGKETAHFREEYLHAFDAKSPS